MTTLTSTSQPSRGRHGNRRSLAALPRPAAFGVVTATTALLLAASSVPTPLYPVYQAEFGFSAVTLTAIFAVYVLALLMSLLTVGRLSDFLGRRPVLAAALLVEAASMAVFLDAHGVAALYAARIVQGLATGAAVGALGAYLLDLQPTNGSRLGSLVNSVAVTGGLGFGSVVTGLLIQYAPHPTRLVFVAFTAVFVALALATAVLPETVEREAGALAALRPQVAVARSARRAFVRATPAIVSTWMLGGLMLSVGGSLLSVVFGQENHAIVGLILGVFSGLGAAVSFVLRNHEPQRIARTGTVMLFVGATVLVIALAASSLTLFVIGAIIAGGGFGPSFLGALRTVSQLAQPHERAALISAVYVVSYLALSIPAVVAGIVITHEGLRDTSLVYAVVVAVVALATLAYEGWSTRRPARA